MKYESTKQSLTKVEWQDTASDLCFLSLLSAGVSFIVHSGVDWETFQRGYFGFLGMFALEANTAFHPQPYSSFNKESHSLIFLKIYVLQVMKNWFCKLAEK